MKNVSDKRRWKPSVGEWRLLEGDHQSRNKRCREVDLLHVADKDGDNTFAHNQIMPEIESWKWRERYFSWSRWTFAHLIPDRSGDNHSWREWKSDPLNLSHSIAPLVLNLIIITLEPINKSSVFLVTFHWRPENDYSSANNRSIAE